jgi:hypothetical protein
MKNILKLIVTILILVVVIIISLVGVPIINTESSLRLVLMILVYLSLSILVMYLYFLVSRVGDILDSVEKGIDLTKDTSKIISTAYSSRKISLRDLIKLISSLKK